MAADPNDPATWKNLDIKQSHILLSFPEDPNGFALEWFAPRFRIENSRWVGIRADGDEEEQDLARRRVIKLRRDAHYPADRVAAGDFLGYHGDFNDFAGELVACKEFAELWGADVS